MSKRRIHKRRESKQKETLQTTRKYYLSRLRLQTTSAEKFKMRKYVKKKEKLKIQNGVYDTELFKIQDTDKIERESYRMIRYHYIE
jgi:hypothetical protein